MVIGLRKVHAYGEAAGSLAFWSEATARVPMTFGNVVQVYELQKKLGNDALRDGNTGYHYKKRMKRLLEPSHN